MARKAHDSASGLVTARNTRRRTSPQDQVILEEAFKRNSKPEKASRTQLAQRLSMGEKEVAIWFQNKRQVARRRSCPPTSEDLTSALASSQGSSCTFNTQYAPSSQESLDHHDDTTPATSQSTANPQPEGSTNQQGNNDLTFSKSDVQDPTEFEHHDKLLQTCSTQTSNIDNKAEDSALLTLAATHNDPSTSKLMPSESKDKSEDANFILYADLQPKRPAQTNTPATPFSLAGVLRRTASQPRLCTSLDGSVRVKTGISPSPSPPRPGAFANSRQARLPGPLQRSQSAVVTPTYAAPNLPASFGRSRDSRAWEFCCDADIRDALTKCAELDQKGSAAAAIGLIRSSSKGFMSTPTPATVPHKRNATAAKSHSPKRPRTDSTTTKSKAKLSRANSSVARLPISADASKTSQSSTQPIATCIADLDKDSKKKPSIEIYEDGNDSDKENWVPGTRISATPRRNRDVRRPATASILRENSYLSSQSTSLTPRLNRGMGSRGNRLGPKRGQENQDPEDDDEVAQFMSGGNSGSVVAGGGDEEDLAGVHGLLSLSQGAWR